MAGGNAEQLMAPIVLFALGFLASPYASGIDMHTNILPQHYIKHQWAGIAQYCKGKNFYMHTKCMIVQVKHDFLTVC